MALTLTNFPSYTPDYKFSFTNTEYDLSEYQNKLASRRDENSLFLRRADLSGMKKSVNKSYEADLETDSASLATNRMVFKTSLESRNSGQITSLYSIFLDKQRSYIPMLASDDEIIDSIINAINSYDEFTFEAISILLEIVRSIIAVSLDSVISKLIVEIGITLSILIQNSLDEIDANSSEGGSNNSAILPLVLSLVETFTDYSICSRSAMISFGILDSVVLIAAKNYDDELTNQCLKTVQSILTKRHPKRNSGNLSSSSFSSLSSSDYGMKSRRIRSTRSTPTSLKLSQSVLDLNTDLSSETELEIDTSNVENIIDPLFEILHLKLEQGSDLSSVSMIINIFVELTSIIPILINRLYTNGLFDIALDSLTVPELTKPSINLIGNLPASSFLSFIQSIIEKGLFEKLMQLIQVDEYTSDVFWLLSNYLEVAPQYVLPLIHSELVTLSVEIASQSSFHIKSEIAYFLSVLIRFMSGDDIVNFLVNEEIIELISEMLNSGVENLTIKCINGFQKLFDLAVQLNSKEFNCNILLQLFDSCDVVKQLDEIVQQIDKKNKTLISCASKLFYDIQSIIGDQQ